MIEHRNRKLSCVTKLIISESCDNGISLIFTSPIVMLPDVTSQNLEINLATVDLPPPLGPTNAVKLPTASSGQFHAAPRPFPLRYKRNAHFPVSHYSC